MSFAYQHHLDDCDCAQCDRARRAADAIIKSAMEAADREIAKRGIPKLRPVEIRPLTKPAYTGAGGKSLASWVAENRPALYDWYHSTMSYGDPESFEAFAAEQFYQHQCAEVNAREWMS